MRVKVIAVECNLCGSQQVEREKGDLEVFGLNVLRAFYVGYGGGGPTPKDTFICHECLDGNEDHGPALLSCLTSLVFDEPERRDYDWLRKQYAPVVEKVKA